MERNLEQIRNNLRQALDRLSDCDLCPRRCLVDRVSGELGFCRTGRYARVSSFGPHFGEEPPLVGRGGSGTIFFSSCNLDCRYCQNWEISHLNEGEEVSAQQLADVMLKLQARGCENINLVSPSHVLAQSLEALLRAFESGLDIPVVYNTGGYDASDALVLLDGAVDIYMPDMKYADDAHAVRLSDAPDYVACNRQAVREMHRQVGDLTLDPQGMATRGLLVRHLVLPGALAGTAEVMRFLATEISADTYVNVMRQYHPAGSARCYPPLDRGVTEAEYDEALASARAVGLRRFDE